MRYVLGILFVAAVGIWQPAAPARGELDALGPQVGERVPDFALVDQAGTSRTLQSILGPNGALLVFFRSAEWWPYCKTQLVQLQDSFPDLQKRGLGLAAISYDSPETLQAFAHQRGITYPLLSDKGSSTIRRYNILNASASGRTAGIPHPGTFVLDRRGVVVSRSFEERYQERASAASLTLTPQDRPPTGSQQAETKHLAVAWWATDTAVAPGTRLSLALEVKPKPKMHVYAPGQQDLIPISLTVDAVDGLRLHKPEYPKPERYFFAPLKETQLVYSHPFKIRQDVTVEVTPAMRGRAKEPNAAVTISGTLRYQACDDNVCYLPQSIPVSWRLKLQAK